MDFDNPNLNYRIWRGLETLPALDAVPAAWRRRTDHLFEPFKLACLKSEDVAAKFVPCYVHPGCAFKIRHGTKDPYIGNCEADPPFCPETSFPFSEVRIWHLDWEKLGRNLARALSLEYRHAEFALPKTQQIGSWSPDAVPVILTIQNERHELRSITGQLAATLRHKFILLTPTSFLVTAPCHQHLAPVGAILVPLDTSVTVTPEAKIVPLKPVSEIFSALHSWHSDFMALTTGSPLSPLPSPVPRFALRKGLGVWELYFEGQRALLNHERGLYYVAWLLYHPDETPIHAIDLMAKIPEFYRQQLGLPELVDPATGKSIILESHARLQERSLALDDRQTWRAIRNKEDELQAILDSDATEPEKAEAYRELEEIIEFLKKHNMRSKNSSNLLTRAVRKAITRLADRLATSIDSTGAPDPTLTSFATFLRKHIITPSASYSGSAHARGSLAGCFTYLPPEGIQWKT